MEEDEHLVEQLFNTAIRQRDHERELLRLPFQQALRKAEQIKSSSYRYKESRETGIACLLTGGQLCSPTTPKCKSTPSISKESIHSFYQTHRSILHDQSSIDSLQSIPILLDDSLRSMQQKSTLAQALLEEVYDEYQLHHDSDPLFLPRIRPLVEPFRRLRSFCHDDWYLCGFRSKIENYWIIQSVSSDPGSIKEALYSWYIGSMLRPLREWTSSFWYPLDGLLPESQDLLYIVWEPLPSLSLSHIFLSLSIREWTSILLLLIYALASAYQKIQFQHGSLTLDSIMLRNIDAPKKYRWESYTFISIYEPVIFTYDHSTVLSSSSNHLKDIQSLYESIQSKGYLTVFHEPLWNLIQEEIQSQQSLSHLYTRVLEYYSKLD